jgi:hypothetical protein
MQYITPPENSHKLSRRDDAISSNENNCLKLGIVLTASVVPMVKGGNFTVAERMEMYMSTLRYYESVIGKKYPIFLLENTSADLSEMESAFKDSLDLTIIQYKPNDPTAYEGFDVTKGKGYNEYLMITKFVKRLAETDLNRDVTHLLKITGRYPMLNIRKIIREIEKRASHRDIGFMDDVKDTEIYDFFHIPGRSSHYGDSRFFMFGKNFYLENLANFYTEMYDYTEGKYAEDCLFNLSCKYRKDRRCIWRFHTQVRFGGISGCQICNREEYNSSINRIKAGVRQALRYIFPHIWF